MELYTVLGFVGILKESNKIFLKNVKLMAFITLTILSLHSLLFLSYTFSIKPLINDFIINATFLQITTPGTSEYAKLLIAVKKDVKLFVGLEWIFILATSITSLFSASITILAAGVTHIGEDMSIKDLLLRIVKSWKRPFITGFYITLLDLGFGFLTWATLSSFMLFFEGPFTSSLPPYFWVILSLAMVFKSYLAVVWNLALVVSVLEERRGIDALGRAGNLVKGLKLRGFFLNILFGLLSSVAVPGFKLTNGKQSTALRVAIVLFFFNCLLVVTMFAMMAFTVFYYECKKNQGEEIESKESFEYTKIANTTAALV
uniref:Transmembrane protein n=1 Tax=Fagus sylvatica TaxID=28930 RepID=A0A2N9HBX9_FAGSY